MTPTDAIRVLVADDHRVVRAGIRAILSAARDIEVIGEATSGPEAVTLARSMRPDVVMMDLSMPDGGGLEATREIAASGIGARVLVLTMHDDEEHRAAAIDAGAAAFLVKSEADRELTVAVRAVAHDEPLARSAVNARRVVHDGTVGHIERDRLELLTKREREILRQVALGYSAPEIGTRLRISPKTVDTYKHRIQEKLDLGRRSEYVQFAFKAGLLDAEAGGQAQRD